MKIDESTLNDIVYKEIIMKINILLSDMELLQTENSNAYNPDFKNLNNQIQVYKDEKQALYEKLLCKEIDIPTYKLKKEALSIKIQECKRVLEVKTKERVKMSKQETFYKCIKPKLQEVIISNTLTQNMVEAFIDKVYIFPDKSIKIIWKFKDMLKNI